MDQEKTETLVPDDAFDMAFEAAALGDTDPDGESAELQAAEEKKDEEEVKEEAVSSGEEEVSEESSESAAEADDVAVEAKEAQPEPEKPKDVAPPKEPEKPEKPKGPTAEEIAAQEQEAADKKAEAEAREQFTDEEKEQLKLVKTDYPEVATLISAVERTLTAKFENTLKQREEELVNKFSQQIEPISQVTQQVATSEHQKAILAEHPDAFDIVSEVQEWIPTQPAILQNQFNEILVGGSAAQVNELLSIYKQATGSAQQVKESAEDKEKKAAKDKKLSSMEGTKSRTTMKKAAVDPDDFDGAFDKFAATA